MSRVDQVDPNTKSRITSRRFLFFIRESIFGLRTTFTFTTELKPLTNNINKCSELVVA